MFNYNLLYISIILVFISSACSQKKTPKIHYNVEEASTSFKSPKEAINKGEFWSSLNGQTILSPISAYEDNRYSGNNIINIISINDDTFQINIDEYSFLLYSSYSFDANHSLIKTGDQILVNRPFQDISNYEKTKQENSIPYLLEFTNSGKVMQFDTHYNYLVTSPKAKAFKKKYIFSDWHFAKLAYIKKMSKNDILAIPKGEVSYRGDLQIKYESYQGSSRKSQYHKIPKIDYTVVFLENSQPILKSSLIKLPSNFISSSPNNFDSLAFSINTTNKPQTEINYLVEYPNAAKNTNFYLNTHGIHLIKNNQYINLPSNVSYQSLLILAGDDAQEIGASIIVNLGNRGEDDSLADDKLFLSVVATKTSIYDSFQ